MTGNFTALAMKTASAPLSTVLTNPWPHKSLRDQSHGSSTSRVAQTVKGVKHLMAQFRCDVGSWWLSGNVTVEIGA